MNWLSSANPASDRRASENQMFESVMAQRARNNVGNRRMLRAAGIKTQSAQTPLHQEAFVHDGVRVSTQRSTKAVHSKAEHYHFDSQYFVPQRPKHPHQPLEFSDPFARSKLYG